MYFSEIFKVRDGKLENFKDWMDQLNTVRREEAVATFAHEHVTREVFALFPSPDGTNYVIAFNEATEIPGKSDLSVPINQDHAAIKKECLEAISEPGQVLLDLRS